MNAKEFLCSHKDISPPRLLYPITGDIPMPRRSYQSCRDCGKEFEFCDNGYVKGFFEGLIWAVCFGVIIWVAATLLIALGIGA